MSDRLYRGDCLEILPTLPARSVQLMLTSPPYNVGWDYADGGASDRLPLGRYLGMLRQFLELLKPVLHEGGVLALNLPATIRTEDHRGYPVAAWAQLELLSQGYLLREPVVWVKSQPGADVYAAGRAVGAPNNPYLRPCYELLLLASVGEYRVAGKSGNHANWPQWDERWGRYLEWLKDVWLIQPGRAKSGEPLAFPAELVARTVLLYSSEGDVVLDPFAGTGTAGQIARDLGRVAWLVERQPAYWDRLEAVIQQVSLPVGGEIGGSR